MIRTTRLIHKDVLFELLQHKDVVKFQLRRSENKSLRNPNLCRVEIYIYISVHELNTILGACAVASATHHWKKQSNKAFITGLGAAKRDGFLPLSNLERLREIEVEEGLNFSILKSIDEKVEPFTILTKG